MAVDMSVSIGTELLPEHVSIGNSEIHRPEVSAIESAWLVWQAEC